MATKWQQLVTALLLCSNLGVILVLAAPRELKEDEVLTLDSSTLSLVRKANEHLLSFTLDTINIQNRWVDEHMSSEKFLKLASLLAPAYMRMGGTTSDAMLFRESSSLEQKQGEDVSRDGETFYMTGNEWKLINEFAIKAGVKLVFSLNALHRSGASWDSSNAKELLEFSNKLGYNVSFQLGNEPDRYYKSYQTNVSGSQLAADFVTLRSLLDSFPRYKSSLLMGPDIASTESYLWEFLAGHNNELSAVSTHQYYVAGNTSKLPAFYDPDVLNRLVRDIDGKMAIIANTSTKAPLWLSETSSAYYGGAINISDRFVAGFTWLDKLAIAAKKGVEVVCRQEIYGHSYSLVNSDLDPNPDWWLSILYKKLVGTGVLNTTQPTGAVRLYAQCSKTSPGSVILFGMNLNSQGVDVQVKGSAAGVGKGKVSAYVLTGETGLQSETVLLNGKRLELGADYILPKLESVSVAASPLHLPAFSLAFFVLEDVQVAACKEN